MKINIKSYIDVTDITEADAIIASQKKLEDFKVMEDKRYGEILAYRMYYILPHLGKIIIEMDQASRAELEYETIIQDISSFNFDNLPAQIFEYTELLVEKKSMLGADNSLDVAQYMVDDKVQAALPECIPVVKVVNYKTSDVHLVFPSMFNITFITNVPMINDRDVVNGLKYFNFKPINTNIENKIVASDAAENDQFGYSVAVSNSKIVIGARYNDDAGDNSGSAYIYDLDGTNEIKLTASDAAEDDWFGNSVAVSDSKIVIGARGNDDNGSYSGSAYIYDLDGTNEIKITASDAAEYDHFGTSVAVSDSKIVIGAYNNDDAGDNSGSAYIYDLDGTNEIKIVASDAAEKDYFGNSVAVSNSKIVVGAYGNDDTGDYSGSAYIYDLDGTNEIKITASDAAEGDYFGYSVAISDSHIVIGAYGNDDAGDNSGSAYIYDLDGTNEIKIVASDAAEKDYFGNSVAVSNSKIVVGAYDNDDTYSNSGSAYIYDLDGTNEIKITASDAAESVQFGNSVAIADSKIVIGAFRNDDAGDNSGSAYIYG